jgi:ABC-type branched-subunit amino acid transport system substrate-binding protein
MRVTGSSHPRRVRIGWAQVLIAALAAAAFALTACGSSKNDTSSSAAAANQNSTGVATPPSGSAATGKPIKVMTIASVNYNGPSYRTILTTAKLAEQWFNNHGGIAGRPLQVATCDDEGDPNKTAACGRKAVQDHAVAVVGSYTNNGESVVPLLAAAKTSWFGICCAATAAELTGSNVQQLGGGLATLAGESVKAVQDGCKHMALVTVDLGALTQLTINLVKGGLKAAGGPPLKSTILVPLGAQDYSPQVAQATDGTDCILGGLSGANYPPFLSALASAGGKQRVYGAQGDLSEKVMKPLGSLSDGYVVTGSYSDISLPAWKDYRAAIAQYHARTDDEYNGIHPLGTWAAYEVFKSVVESMKGTIDAPSFLAAAQKAKVTFSGVASRVDFSRHFDGLGKSFANFVNRSVTYDTVHDGKLVPFQGGKFYDMTNAMVGRPLPATDLPPAGQ